MTNKKHTIKQLQGKKAEIHPGSRRGASSPSPGRTTAARPAPACACPTHPRSSQLTDDSVALARSLSTAGQMDRIILRKSKLSKANQLRNRSRKGKLERPHFWFDSLPEPPFAAHSLESLHRLVHDLFLRRWDDYLAELKKERRAGRPKCKEQVEVEEIKRQEEAEYDTGFGRSPLPSLALPPSATCALLLAAAPRHERRGRLRARSRRPDHVLPQTSAPG